MTQDGKQFFRNMTIRNYHTFHCETIRNDRFLDILLDNSHPSIVTSVYRKKTLTGLLTNYFSFAPLNYKLGLVRTLVDRVYKINNSWAGFHLEVKKLIVKTTRHICAHVREHLLSDKSSHVYRHLQSSRACHDSCTAECFTILDSAVSKFQIKIKEAMHIKWENPTLNQQLKHLELSLPF